MRSKKKKGSQLFNTSQPSMLLSSAARSTAPSEHDHQLAAFAQVPGPQSCPGAGHEQSSRASPAHHPDVAQRDGVAHQQVPAQSLINPAFHHSLRSIDQAPNASSSVKRAVSKSWPLQDVKDLAIIIYFALRRACNLPDERSAFQFDTWGSYRHGIVAPGNILDEVANKLEKAPPGCRTGWIYAPSEVQASSALLIWLDEIMQAVTVKGGKVSPAQAGLDVHTTLGSPSAPGWTNEQMRIILSINILVSKLYLAWAEERPTDRD